MNIQKEKEELLSKAYECLKAHDNGDDSKLEEGLRIVERMLQMNPFNKEALIYKALALSAVNKPNEAILCLNHVIKSFPSYHLGYLNKGSALFSLHKYQEALECFNKAIELEPNDAQIYHNKGNCQSSLGHLEESLNSYAYASKLEPRNPKYLNSQGVCLYEMKMYKRAEELFEKASQINPRTCDYHFNKGNCFLELKKYEEALNCFTKASLINPLNCEIMKQKGKCLRLLNNIKKAIEEFSAALKICPHDCESYFNIAEMYTYNLKDFAQGIKYFDKILKLESKNRQAYLQKGDCHMMLQQYEEAIGVYDKACEISPLGIEYLVSYNKGISCMNLRRNEQALEYINKCIQIKPDDDELHDFKQRILARFELEKKEEEKANCMIN